MRHRVVGLGVVADRVAIGDDPEVEAWKYWSEDPDLEERARHTFALEDGEHLRRVGTRAVVEGERDLAVLRARDLDVRRARQGPVDGRILGRLLLARERPLPTPPSV